MAPLGNIMVMLIFVWVCMWDNWQANLAEIAALEISLSLGSALGKSSAEELVIEDS